MKHCLSPNNGSYDWLVWWTLDLKWRNLNAPYFVSPWELWNHKLREPHISFEGPHIVLDHHTSSGPILFLTIRSEPSAMLVLQLYYLSYRLGLRLSPLRFLHLLDRFDRLHLLNSHPRPECCIWSLWKCHGSYRPAQGSCLRGPRQTGARFGRRTGWPPGGSGLDFPPC